MGIDRFKDIKKLKRVGHGVSGVTDVIERAGSSYISKGEFGNVHSKEFIVGGRKVLLAEKSVHKGGFARGRFSRDIIDRVLSVHKLLKDAGVNTYTTLRSDGKAFYSTLLNRGGFVALSANNDTPRDSAGNEYEEISIGKIEIANLQEMCEEIVRQTNIALSLGIGLTHDSIFYIVPEDVSHGPVDVDFMIGDFDSLGVVESLRHDDEEKSNILRTMHGATMKFIRIYCNIEALLEYESIVNEVFDEAL